MRETSPPRFRQAATEAADAAARGSAPFDDLLGEGATRVSLESLAELEAVLEEQHNTLIARGFISAEHSWRAGMMGQGQGVHVGSM